MVTVPVSLTEHRDASYDIVIGRGVLADLPTRVRAACPAARYAVITDSHVAALYGETVVAGLRDQGLPAELFEFPAGEWNKTRETWAALSDRMLARQFGRDAAVIALGGGVVGDVAGFVAASYLRGVPYVQVPTTLMAMIDSSIGGKTGVDIDEGKNLVGAFHQPIAIISDISVLATVEPRHRRSALAEAVKMAALGHDRLFEVLERDGPGIVDGDPGAIESGALAEVVELAWAKVEVVLADEREGAARISLNLGHSLGHAIEAAAGFGGLLHGESVAYGLRGAVRIGVRRGTTPAELADRVERLLDHLELGVAPLSLELDRVLELLEADKKHAGGALRWVLATGSGFEVDAEVPAELVREVAAEVLAGRAASAGTTASAGTSAAPTAAAGRP